MTVYMVVAFIITYLICSVNPAIEICKLKTGEDIRKLGSGNAGTANAMRVLGKPLGTVVIICDILKVFISLAIVYVIGKIFKQDISVMLKSVFILAAVIGHCYPIYYKFRGGKGVIVGMTTAFILDAKTALIYMYDSWSNCYTNYKNCRNGYINWNNCICCNNNFFCKRVCYSCYNCMFNNNV